MKISMIAAMAKDRVIGNDNAMPWHLPADFAWFKQHTLNKPVIMGRKTFESIGKPLPNRRNIVVSRQTHSSTESLEYVESIEQALALINGVEEVMIIGGGTIYQACLPYASRLYLTFIDANIEGDTRFPEWGDGWEETHTETYAGDEKNVHAMRFVILDKMISR